MSFICRRNYFFFVYGAATCFFVQSRWHVAQNAIILVLFKAIATLLSMMIMKLIKEPGV